MFRPRLYVVKGKIPLDLGRSRVTCLPTVAGPPTRAATPSSSGRCTDLSRPHRPPGSPETGNNTNHAIPSPPTKERTKKGKNRTTPTVDQMQHKLFYKCTKTKRTIEPLAKKSKRCSLAPSRAILCKLIHLKKTQGCCYRVANTRVCRRVHSHSVSYGYYQTARPRFTLAARREVIDEG